MKNTERLRTTKSNNLFLASEFYRVSSLLPDMLRKPAERCRVVFIPTAAKVALKPPAKLGEKISAARWQEIDFVKKSLDALSEIGFTDIQIVDTEGKSKKELRKEIGSPDVLFVAGGNPFALTRDGFPKFLRKCLKRRDSLYVGSSAGTVIFGAMTGQDHGHLKELSNLPTFNEEESTKNKKKWERGVGTRLIKATILPHADDEEDEAYRQEVKQECVRRRVNVIELTNDEALVGRMKRGLIRRRIVYSKVAN